MRACSTASRRAAIHLARDAGWQGEKQITEGTGVNNWPSFSLDGKTLVYGSSRTNTYEIYSSDADGKNVKQLTDNEAMDIRPEISPDGKRIVFTSMRDGNRELYAWMWTAKTSGG